MAPKLPSSWSERQECEPHNRHPDEAAPARRRPAPRAGVAAGNPSPGSYGRAASPAASGTRRAVPVGRRARIRAGGPTVYEAAQNHRSRPSRTAPPGPSLVHAAPFAAAPACLRPVVTACPRPRAYPCPPRGGSLVAKATLSGRTTTAGPDPPGVTPFAAGVATAGPSGSCSPAAPSRAGPRVRARSGIVAPSAQSRGWHDEHLPVRRIRVPPGHPAVIDGRSRTGRPALSRPSAVHRVASLTSRVLAEPSGCLPRRPSTSVGRTGTPVPSSPRYMVGGGLGTVFGHIAFVVGDLTSQGFGGALDLLGLDAHRGQFPQRVAGRGEAEVGRRQYFEALEQARAGRTRTDLDGRFPNAPPTHALNFPVPSNHLRIRRFDSAQARPAAPAVGVERPRGDPRGGHEPASLQPATPSG